MSDWLLIAGLLMVLHTMAAIAADPSGGNQPKKRKLGETGVGFVGRAFHIWFFTGLKGYAVLLYGSLKIARWLVTPKETKSSSNGPNND